MKKNKNIIFYAAVIGIFGFLMWFIVQQGKKIEPVKMSAHTLVDGSAVKHHPAGNKISNFVNSFVKNFEHPLAILILQIIAIIITARIFGYLFNKIKQPTVIGEITAGIFLGPSVAGIFFPSFSHFLFPVQSLANLQLLSQIGLIFFMFIIGMELDLKVLKNKAHAAVVISHSSIIFPYFLGTLLAYFLYEKYAPVNITFVSFALFMGIAMSITAFPVLARIIQERGITKTGLGTMAITCAAADDITAWCILAAVVAIVNAGSFINAAFTISLSVLYLFFMMKVVRPFLERIGSIYISKEMLNKTIIAFVFLILLTSACLTEVIGIHALFGAFLAGTIMPQNIDFKKILIEKIEDISLVILLPLFFVFTGLRTQIGLLNDVNLWLVCAAIISIAILGKFGGGAISAKFVGLSWKESLSLGALMNTRGLMELIVLNIGYDLGILTPEIFAMMVLMALVTTFLTGPALDLINRFVKDGVSTVTEPFVEKAYNILISFAQPMMGSKLLKLAYQLSGNKTDKSITALHLTPTSEVNPENAIIYEAESFKPIKKTAEELELPVFTIYKATDEVQKGIIRTANKGPYNLLLVGSAKPVFTKDKLGGKIKNLLEDTNCTTGVLIDKGFSSAKTVLMLLNKKDEFLTDYVQGLAHFNTFIDLVKMDGNLNLDELNGNPEIEIKDLNHIHHLIKNEGSIRDYDLIITSVNCWNAISNSVRELLEQGQSILLIKP